MRVSEAKPSLILPNLVVLLGLSALLASPVAIPAACAATGGEDGSCGGAADALLGAAPDTAAMMARARFLTSPLLAGRGNGTAVALVAADSIARWFAGAGLRPGLAAGWFQEFDLTGQEHGGLAGRNVVGLLPGRGSLASRYVVVGAHYDHLGRMAGPGASVVGVGERTADPQPAAQPAPAEPGRYFPGANDNASGVTVLVEIGRLLARRPAETTAARSCLLVAFAGEEIGLQGSTFFVSHAPVPLDSISVMINLDCVGTLHGDPLLVGGVGTSSALAELVAEAAADGPPLVTSPQPWAGSDHVPFQLARIPVLFLFTGAYAEYNRPADDWTILDAAGMARVAAFTARLARELRGEPSHLAYTPATAPPPPLPGEKPVQRAWLGVVPDFTAPDSGGVTLAGVSEGSPAEAVGLTAGDVVISLAGEPVGDLQDLTRLLREHEAGEAVELEVRRDGRRFRYLIVLAERADRRS
jgi:aminopeptidase N